MPRSEGSCLPGGPLNGNPPPLPTRSVPFRQPAQVKPTPLPARRDGSRDYQRRWARSHGFHVYAVGALPKKVLDAYEDELEAAGMSNPKDHRRVHYAVHEHKAGRLANGCRCGLQAGHEGDH